MLKEVEPGDLKCIVVDYWHAQIGWNWNELEDYLSGHVIRRLTSYMLVDEDEQKDDICWRNEPSGKISVTSVHNIVNDHVGT